LHSTAFILHCIALIIVISPIFDAETQYSQSPSDGGKQSRLPPNRAGWMVIRWSITLNASKID
jgi:hypothetical protein